MFFRLERSGKVLFIVVAALALVSCSVLLYYLWSISYSTDEDYELYQGPFETRALFSHTKQFSSSTTPKLETTTTTKARNEHADITQHPNYRLFNKPDCGLISQIDMRVVNGEIAKLNSNPWIVVLYNFFSETNSTEMNCAGTLISESLVLTAAHCVKRRPAFIRLGEHNLKTNPDCEEATDGKRQCADPYQQIDDFEILKHEFYHASAPTDQDIALIRLKIPARTRQNNINTVCLPFSPIEEPKSKEMLEVIGFGRLANGSNSEVLMVGQVPNVPLEECERIYTPGLVLDSGNMCAGGDKKTHIDSCNGDSGGPLQRLRYVRRQARVIQFGIVSGGPRDVACGKLPGIYTRVHTYLEWILNNADFES